MRPGNFAESLVQDPFMTNPLASGEAAQLSQDAPFSVMKLQSLGLGPDYRPDWLIAAVERYKDEPSVYGDMARQELNSGGFPVVALRDHHASARRPAQAPVYDAYINADGQTVYPSVPQRRQTSGEAVGIAQYPGWFTKPPEELPEPMTGTGYAASVVGSHVTFPPESSFRFATNLAPLPEAAAPLEHAPKPSESEPQSAPVKAWSPLGSVAAGEVLLDHHAAEEQADIARSEFWRLYGGTRSANGFPIDHAKRKDIDGRAATYLAEGDSYLLQDVLGQNKEVEPKTGRLKKILCGLGALATVAGTAVYLAQTNEHVQKWGDIMATWIQLRGR